MILILSAAIAIPAYCAICPSDHNSSAPICLTYHRWARKDQMLACYPQFPEFLRMKQKHDPKEVIQSDWYRHYKTMFAQSAKLILVVLTDLCKAGGRGGQRPAQV